MRFYTDKNNPEFFFVEDEGLIKAAAVIPYNKPSPFLYADSGVSLTHLVKEASDFFIDGKVLFSKDTMVVDSRDLEKLAKLWRPLGQAISKVTGTVGRGVAKTVAGTNQAIQRQMVRASGTEFGRQAIGNLATAGYKQAINPHLMTPGGVGMAAAGAVAKAAKPAVTKAVGNVAGKGLQNLGAWGTGIGRQAQGVPFIKGMSARPHLEYIEGLSKLGEQFCVIEKKFQPIQKEWILEKLGSLLVRAGDSFISRIQFSKEAKSIEESELELWKQYKEKGDKKALSKLMVSMKPLVKSRVAPWMKNSPLPSSAVEAEGMRLLRHAINTYDPSKGAQLKTHAWHNLSKIHRYGYTYQNVGSIPEPRAAKVGTYQNAEEILRDKYNREPTLQELQDELSWGVSDIKAMQEELRKDLVLDDTLGPVISNNTDVGTEALHLVYHDANPKQKLIMEYTFDEFENKPTIGGNAKEVAKKIGATPNEVRKNYKWIAGQINKLMSMGESELEPTALRIVPW